MLGIETNIDEEDLVENEVLDSADAFTRGETPSKDSLDTSAA